MLYNYLYYTFCYLQVWNVNNQWENYKNVDIKLSAHDTFVESPSPGTLNDCKTKWFENPLEQ